MVGQLDPEQCNGGAAVCAFCNLPAPMCAGNSHNDPTGACPYTWLVCDITPYNVAKS